MPNETYTPELGQALFGQPSQAFEVPEIMEAALASIRDRLDILMWNRTQEEYASPFGNTGNSYTNETFRVVAYSWGSDEQPFNFAWRDLRISWYKYFGRGMSANLEITPDLASECLTDCLRSLAAHAEAGR
jgi:hypothetical protein